MLLKSTRNYKNKISALDAVLKGISEDGGLFVPDKFPKLSLDEIESLKSLTYQKLSAKILNMFFDEIDLKEMEIITEKTYSSFDKEEVVPLRKLDDGKFILELFHGPTLAFKDMALQILPRLMAKALEQKGIDEDILILTATSGDTGKAALEGFKNAHRVKILVFYPDEGVSDMQKLQMVTQEGDNVSVVAVKGNFDDTQNGVKAIFIDLEKQEKVKEKGYVLSSANSINIGRLAPQIVYYFWSYLCLINSGEIKIDDKINVVVPTGNFGNILAAYYAEKMGLPINKFICASNTNRVLTDFFNKKEYNLKEREFVKTMSPSMDILISSNLERLVSDIVSDDKVLNKMFSDLKDKGIYDISEYMDENKTDKFYANWASEKRTKKTIKDTFDKYGYLLDPHTAVAVRVCDDYLMETDDKTPCIIVSTASPYKFSDSVLEALDIKAKGDVFSKAEHLAKLTQTDIPDQILSLKEKSVLHNKIIDKGEMFNSILDTLK